MSEQLANKMIRFEATPPDNAWEAIAARLEDDKQHAVLSTKMNQFETVPPAGIWKAITERLEDDTQYASLAEKMNQFDATPPYQSWQSITQSLDGLQHKAIPVTISRKKLLYRMAAAAVVVGLLIGGWLFTNNNGNNTLVKNSNDPVPANPANATGNNTAAGDQQPVQKETTASIQQTEDQGSGKTQHHTIAQHTDHPVKYAIVNGIPAYENAPIIISSAPILDKDGLVIRDMDVLTTNSNYLTVMGPNGQVTRISAKFASVIRYLNGNSDNDAEEYLDKVIKESDTWKKRFQEWRNKISQSSFIPSSTNFLDIIEFKELIQENK